MRIQNFGNFSACEDLVGVRGRGGFGLGAQRVDRTKDQSGTKKSNPIQRHTNLAVGETHTQTFWGPKKHLITQCGPATCQVILSTAYLGF